MPNHKDTSGTIQADHLLSSISITWSKPFHLSLTTYFSFDLDFVEVKLPRKLFCQILYFSDLTLEKVIFPGKHVNSAPQASLSSNSPFITRDLCPPTVFIYLFIIYLPPLICLSPMRKSWACLFHHCPLGLEDFLEHSRSQRNC